MERRSATILWPFNRSYITNQDDLTLIGKLPPTIEDIMVNFRSSHMFAQIETKRQSTLQNSCEQTVDQAVQWWARAEQGINAEPSRTCLKLY